MRNLLFILLAVLLLPCCVHQPQNGVRSLLKEAERMIRTSPDTAYFLLREMGATMDLQTKADNAYHGLLLRQAHVERLKQKEALGKLQIYKHNMYVVVLMIVLVVVIIWAVYKIRKLYARHQAEERVRKNSEDLCETLESEKNRLAEEIAFVKMQLQQKEADLYQQKEELRTERDILMQKEQEIKSLQLQLDKLTSGTIHLFDKIKQIISNFCADNRSEIKMKEVDWLQLQVVMDKRWNGAIGRIQNKYLLSDMEVRLFCLHLTDIPTANLSFLFDRQSRDFIYTNTRDLFVKLGIERGKRTCKKALEIFIENQG